MKQLLRGTQFLRPSTALQLRIACSEALRGINSSVSASAKDYSAVPCSLVAREPITMGMTPSISRVSPKRSLRRDGSHGCAAMQRQGVGLGNADMAGEVEGGLEEPAAGLGQVTSCFGDAGDEGGKVGSKGGEDLSLPPAGADLGDNVLEFKQTSERVLAGPLEPAAGLGQASSSVGRGEHEAGKVGSGAAGVVNLPLAGGDGGDKKQEVRFQLTDSCSLVLHRGDITKWHVDGKTDAIVNAANERMLGGGGVDGAIHRAAGRKLLDACLKVPEVSRGVRCPVGKAVVTGGFNLPSSRVIHTVGPIYSKANAPQELLAKAYKNSVAAAVEAGVKYIAFPAISCGVYGYPYEEAAQVALQALQESGAGLLEVHFVFSLVDPWKAWLAKADQLIQSWST